MRLYAPHTVYVQPDGTVQDGNGEVLTPLPEDLPARDQLVRAGFVCVEQVTSLGRDAIEGVVGITSTHADAIFAKIAADSKRVEKAAPEASEEEASEEEASEAEDEVPEFGSPTAERLARQYGLDPRDITATGARGILVRDVERAREARKAEEES